ncbi:MAG: hypothetical protein AAFN04_08385 [Pseudomonadota bacterium]
MKTTIFKNAILVLSALATVGASTTTAHARPIDEDDFVAGKETILDDKGYLFLSTPSRWVGTLIKEPNADDVARYKDAYEEAFAEATERYEKDYARYLKRMEKPKTDRPMPKEPVKPERDTFRIIPIEQFMAIRFGPTNVFSKGDGAWSYLEEIDPGMYTWYGPIFVSTAQGPVGLCYCMGTVKFEVRAGEITNLGNSLYALPKWEDDPIAPPLAIGEPMGLGSVTVNLPTESSPVAYDLPASLEGQPSRNPEYFAVGKINNFYGRMVGRMAPIEGVLAYDRDRVIDVKAELAAEAEEPAELEPGWITDGA